ncbi:nucleoid-associated protein [Leptolinea tardivitalis]|uniref:Nucleoid-associated protein NdpA n=1 Tax=Leptolinea tardivitalis TaxID=229920 RepID=A0A0P6WQY6_9CHLR|nr:nucleoid-associated protein [Leptolinea tardivitalis]KPL72493.1 hypothetical protein ADM99_04995 [Leptolinea tardivitalis]GAP21223.1 37-kD nucleoid-associated bacterial protein [Leptolinea tardivitalis]
MATKLISLAYHLVDKKKPELKFSQGVIKAIDLPKEILDFFVELTDKLIQTNDSGNCVSGNFQKVDAETLIKDILDAPEKLFDDSIELANILFESSPKNASRGLLAILHCHDGIINKDFLAIYKIKCEDEKIIKIVTGEQIPQLKVEELRDILFRQLQKGAIYPHPNKKNFDIKVFDLQTQDEPRKYFSQVFLGCKTKLSDEHQIKRLVPELNKFSLTNGIKFYKEKVPRFLSTIGQIKGDIEIQDVEKAIKEQQLFGEGYTSEKFHNYVIQSNDLADFKIESPLLLKMGTGIKRKVKN